MIEIFGTNYYVIFAPIPLLVVLAILLLMMVAVVTIRWFEHKKLMIPKGLAISILVVMALEVILFWDVYWVGKEAKRLCEEEGGLHVYRTVEVETFETSGGANTIRKLLKQGYPSVVATDRSEKPHQLYRYTLINNQIQREPISEFVSRYRVIGSYKNPSHPGRFDYPTKVLNRYVKKSRYILEDQKIGEVLGELVYYSIFPGIVDVLLVGMSGLTFTPWFCGDEQIIDGVKTGKRISITNLAEATLKPKSTTKQGE